MYYNDEVHYSEYKTIECKSALNRVSGMGFNWSLNPYQGCYHACVYCFARVYAKLADRDPGLGFSTQVAVKSNIASMLRMEMAKKSNVETVVIGTATDPYQPIEGKFRLTRQCLEIFIAYPTPIQIITKGTLILRDLDWLVKLAKKAPVTINFSIPSIDPEVWKRVEPGTPHPLKRMKVMQKLVEAGIEAGVGMAPLLPEINDRPDQIRETVKAASQAKACFLWSSPVNLRPGTREYFFDFLNEQYPNLVKNYESIFVTSYLPKRITSEMRERVSNFRKLFPVYDRRQLKLLPPEKPTQLSLF